MRRFLRWGFLVVIGAFLLIQLVPYGRDHSNPPVTKAARWPDARSAALFRDSCADCHSNRTDWRWYTNIAPVSWLVQKDVDEGRSTLNFSEWNKPQPGESEIADQIASGEMPPSTYTIVHPGASLTASEKRELVVALHRLFATDPPAGTKSGG